MSEPDPASAATGYSGALRRGITWSVPLLIALGGLGWYLLEGRHVSSDNAYLRADTISVASRVDGMVVDVAVKSDAVIRAGDLLLRLDDTEAKLALARADAELAAERNEIESLQAQLEVRRAEQAAARSSHEYRSREERRLEGLARSGIVSRISFDAATEQAREAADRLAVATRATAELESRLGGVTAVSVSDHPRVRLLQALVEQAQVHLGYTRIIAPHDGQAGQIRIFAGEQVKAGDTLLTIVANQQPWLEVNLKETQLARLLPGQPATVRVDAYPDVEWRATVASIGPATGAEFALLPPENASGNWVKVVQRVPVRLEFAEGGPPLTLRSGMSAKVRIDTGEANRRFRRWLQRPP